MEHNIFLVFICGGFLCLLAQLLIDLTRLTPARILVTYVCLGVFIYSIGLYDPAFDLFGCGISIPLTGFGAVIGRGVREAVIKDGFLGIITGGLSASSAGISAALLFGFLAALFFRSKSRRMSKGSK